MKKIHQLNDSHLAPINCRLPDFPFDETTDYAPRGELGFRLEWSIKRIEEQLPYSQEYILSQISGDEGEWSNFPRFHGDIAGRWILAESTVHSSREEAPMHLKDIVVQVIALQNDDGSFGKISHEENPLNMHKMYGNGWLLRGLTQYAAVYKDTSALKAAQKLGGYYKSVFPIWTDSSMSEGDTGFYAVTKSCYFHAFDGLVALYRLTLDNSYLDLAGAFIGYLTPLEDSDHSHMYLTIRRGLIEYYREKGETGKIQSLSEELKTVRERFILETGGVPERFKENGDEAFDEGCSLFDWELICLRLHQITEDPSWMDGAILNLENQIYYNQCYNGGFGSFQLGEGYRQYGKEAPWCCSLFGPWGLAKSGAFLVEKRQDVVRINHLVSGVWKFTDAGSLTIDVQHRKNRIRFCTEGPLKELSLYLPHWLKIPGYENDRRENRITLSVSDNELTIPFEYILWCAEPGRSPRFVVPEPGIEVNLFYGPYMLTHRSHDIPEVDLGSLEEPQWLRGLNSYGEGYRLSLKSNLQKSPNDVFLGVNEAPDDLYFYCLKDKESPDSNRPKVRLK